MNPVWDKSDKEQDVSVIEIKDRLTWSDAVQPACMAHRGWELPDGYMCVVTGWGQTAGTGNYGSKELRQAKVQKFLYQISIFMFYILTLFRPYSQTN